MEGKVGKEKSAIYFILIILKFKLKLHLIQKIPVLYIVT